MTDTTAPAFTERVEKFELHRKQLIVKFRIEVDKRLEASRKKKLDPNLNVELERGWLIPYLFAADLICWKRWEHWIWTYSIGGAVPQPIPKICFAENKAVRKHIERCLDLIPNQGHESWMGWGSWENLNYFYAWILYGLGSRSHKTLPKEPTPGASMRLYQVFDINALIAYPYDYWGDLMAECNIGRSAGFYPTPHTVAHMMALMTFRQQGVDVMKLSDDRLKAVQDCAVGTGRMLLEASNYSYKLYGQDILLPCVQACLINFALYAPWGYRPLRYWDYRPTIFSSDEQKKSWLMVSRMKRVMRELDRTYEASPEDDETSFFSYSDTQAAQAYLADTEHDTEEQWRYEPIKKRRKTQGEPNHVQGALW